ncbi:MAG: ParM/StbA family protein [Bacillota bacterium]
MAIDLGYGYLKGVNDQGERVLFPSVVAPARDLLLADLSRNSTGYAARIQRVSGAMERAFVGDLALREGRGVGFTLERNKLRHPAHDVLLLTAARLLWTGRPCRLVVGLPVAYYRSQRDMVRKYLSGLAAHVEVDDRAQEWVTFDDVLVYPQGVGALLTVQGLPTAGLVGVVDVGYKTTDYVVAECYPDTVRPVSTLCGSIEFGAYTVRQAVQDEFLRLTGAPLDNAVLPMVLQTGTVTFRSRPIDLRHALDRAREEVAQAIADRLFAAWDTRGDFLQKVYLAGGGVLEIPLLKRLFPGAEILGDAQFANAAGFLKAAMASRG